LQIVVKNRIYIAPTDRTNSEGNCATARIQLFSTQPLKKRNGAKSRPRFSPHPGQRKLFLSPSWGTSTHFFLSDKNINSGVHPADTITEELSGAGKILSIATCRFASPALLIYILLGDRRR
jgi:hypothetical protein